MDTPPPTLTAKDLGLCAEEEEPLDVLDLPQLYTKPNARALLSTLSDLSSQPASWDVTPRSGTPRTPLSGASTPYRRKRKVRSEGLPNYLTKIISSPLAWIEDDVQKERIWEAASQRLSERSGRTAMGALSRSFIIPLDPEPVTLSGDAGDGFTINQVEAYIGLSDEYVELTLHEPALTGDDLGLKTWASSYLLAKRMATLRNTLPVMPPGEMVLELGSGTGLVGLAAACILGRHTILTDLPEIVDNLNRNSQANALTLSSHGGHTDTAVLDWSRPETFLLEGKHTGEAHMFPLILAADPIYSSDHPRLLAQAVEYHLSQSPHARVVVEMPLRDAYVAERDDFRSRMSKIGLVVVETGEEIGYDDWSTGDEDEPSEVRCWWSVWARRSSPLGGP